MSMIRHLAHYEELGDAVLLHSARHTDDVIFGPELRELAERHRGFALHEQLTRDAGRMAPADLDRLCPDWREREAYLSGPADMLDAFTEHWEQRRRLRSPAHGALPAQARASATAARARAARSRS